MDEWIVAGKSKKYLTNFKSLYHSLLPHVYASNKTENLIITKENQNDIAENNQENTNLKSKTLFNYDGWIRLKKMFLRNEIEEVSPQLRIIYQSLSLSFFLGGICGCFIGTRGVYENFVRANEASIYLNTRDAQRKLQDSITLNMMRGGWRWGWRTSLFTGIFMTLFYSISTYKGQVSLSSFVIAGGLSGAIYRINLGPRFVLGGCLVGSILGVLGGGMSFGILYLSDYTFEDLMEGVKDNRLVVKRDYSDIHEKDRLLLTHNKWVKTFEEENKEKLKSVKT